jgi:signal transduction histidine kinase/ligand-binding sensor domain-containing protein
MSLKLLSKNSSFSPDAFRRAATLALRAAATLVVWASLVQTVWAVDPDRAISQYVHDEWGPEQGFPKGPVYAITQTPDGYIWIGTDEGLVRFDGWNFRLMKDDSGSFTITSVLGLEPDPNGCLWVRLQDSTILRYCNGRFDRPLSNRTNINIAAMTLARNGELLIAKSEQGAFVVRGGGFQMLASAADLPRSPVTSLAQTRDGAIFMGTRDAGLFRIADGKDGGKVISIRNGLPDLKVNFLLPDGEHDIWVGTDNGVARWNGTQFVTVGIPPSGGRMQALVILKDHDGNVWVGTDSRGLLRLNAHGVASFISESSSPQAVTALFEGREGCIWIGHADGMERLRDSAFVTYSDAEGLPTDGSNPVFVDSTNRLWFPPATGGLWWSKDSQHGHVTADGLNDDIVYALDGGPGELWAGRQRGGLTRLAFSGAAFNGAKLAARTWTHADGLAGDSVSSVFRSRDGTVWAGTLSAGVSRLRDGRFTNFTEADGLASNTVSAILESADGTMWFATPGGLSKWSGGRWTSFRSSAGLPSEDVNCLLEDSTGVLWTGTASGIAFRKGETFQVPRGAPAILREPIMGMAEGRYGSLWVATSGHVVRVNRDRLFQGTLGDGDIREFGLADGLRGTQGAERNRSVIADSAGRIWFSLNHGISMIDPARLTSGSPPAIVHIEGISADGVATSLRAPVRIPGGSRRITFAFSGLILSVPARVRYKYRLEGYDTTWSDPSPLREAAYTNLSPRHYRFDVMATNVDGIWSPAEAAVEFEVLPLFWETWWFGLGVLAGIVACIVALYRLRLQQATNRINLRFQERLAERTRIAQELHDTLLQGFLSASMQVHVAADRLPDDSAVKPTLNRALELMRQVIDEGRNAVRGLRSTRSASLDLEQSFARIQQEIAGSDPDSERVEFRVVVDGERRPLHPVLRDEVYRIGREAVINAFRHAHAGKIEMELRYSARNLTLMVRDDGWGIDPNVLKTGRDGHFGLVGMRERADRIGARLHVMSRASAGTEIELSIPGNIVFQNGKVK